MPKQTYIPTPADKATGARVRQLRKLAGETLVETARRSGISFGYATLCRVELGERQLSIPDATKLAAHFNTTVDRVLIQAPAVTEQAWLGNEPSLPPLFLVEPKTRGLTDADLFPNTTPANVLEIDLDNPLSPDEYRMTVWVPYLEARYNADQKAS